MPRKVVLKTAKAGATAADRRVIAGASTTSAAPTTESDGQLLDRNEFVHLLGKTGGTTPVFTVQVWYYTYVSGEWHKGETLNFSDNDLHSIETQGLDKIYVQIIAVTGTTPTLDLWIAWVVPQ